MAEEAKETNSPLSLDLSPDTPWPVGPIEVRTRTSISDLQGLNRVLGRALHDALPENGPPMPSFAAAVSSEAEDPEDTEYLEEVHCNRHICAFITRCTGRHDFATAARRCNKAS